MANLTPMMQQYLQVKEKYKDCILLYRLGDFYEMFFEDAEEASQILNIALTSRNKGSAESVPLCGVPYHSVEGYLQKLIQAGRRVAICEQVEDPKLAKGVVKREVVRVVTPGTNVTDDSDDGNQLLASLFRGKEFSGFAYINLSTGLFRVTALKTDEVEQEIERVAPKELLLAKGDNLKTGAMLNLLSPSRFDEKIAEKLLREPLPDTRFTVGLKSAGALLWYLKETQKDTPISHINSIEFYSPNRFLVLDPTTIRNLELFQTQSDASLKGSLFNTLNETVTKMGSRYLKEVLQYPLKDVKEINERLNKVSAFFNNDSVREKTRDQLKNIKDIERLIGRLTMGLANARDLVALGGSLKPLTPIQSIIGEERAFNALIKNWDNLTNVTSLIDRAINPDPPLTLREGRIIREGYHKELDELIHLTREGKSFLADLESRERERTGIPLKVKFNSVFGYYIEITKSHLKKVPQDYIRKQTLVNAERFITPELKEFEDKVLTAEERRNQLEYDLFQKIREEVLLSSEKIKYMARVIARFDLLSSFAEIARRRNYVLPTVNDSHLIDIKQGRHPVVEQMRLGESFIPNDITLDNDSSRMLIITGPNMAGKSTVMRQVALIVLMAQSGSFVPAVSATIGVVDQIFTRVGASDRLSQGESTFMVEMLETANILRRATSNSLIILDEIGRGTSTYDGVSIAWAVAEMIDQKIGAKTMFATHYHELTVLADKFPKIQNFQIAVKEWKGEIIFLRQLIPGATSRSYGIEVARLAGLPDIVVRRAREILKDLESEKPKGAEATNSPQLDFFASASHPVLKSIEELDLAHITPMDALNRLHDFKTQL